MAEIDSVLLVKKKNPRSTLFKDASVYKKEKEQYDKAGYIEATPEQVADYFKRQGIKLEAEKEVTKPKTTKKKAASKSTDKGVNK